MESICFHAFYLRQIRRNTKFFEDNLLNNFFSSDTENKNYDGLEKRSRYVNSTTLSQKESGSFDSEKRKRRSSGHISDDCNVHIPEKSLLLSVSCT